MPPARGKFVKPKNIKTSIKGILSYLKPYTGLLIIVVLCIIAATFSSTYASYILGNAIKEGITNHMNDAAAAVTWDYLIHSELGKNVIKMAIVYLIALISSYAYQRIMVNVSTGVLKKIRDDLFVHMETLDIKYFDTNTHGELMSRFTNDTDAIREMLSQGIPQFISSLCSIVFVFTFMVIISIPLTIIVIIALIGLIQVVKFITKRSSKYFIANQKNIGKLNELPQSWYSDNQNQALKEWEINTKLFKENKDIKKQEIISKIEYIKVKDDTCEAKLEAIEKLQDIIYIK